MTVLNLSNQVQFLWEHDATTWLKNCCGAAGDSPGPLGSPQLKRTTATKYVMPVCRSSVRNTWKYNINPSSCLSSSDHQPDSSSALLFDNVKISFRWARTFPTSFPRAITLSMKISRRKEGKWFAQDHSAPGRRMKCKLSLLKDPALTRRWHCQLFWLKLVSFLLNQAAQPAVPVRSLHAEHHPRKRPR